MESLAPFKKYNRNGLNLTIECCRSTSLDEQMLDWAFDLTKKNMQTLYETSSCGWRPREKREELTDDRAWYLIARETDGTPVGLIHFRFDMDFDDEVLYCYEIQLVEEVRRKGLGKFLMQILSLLAYKTHMKKVVLTVFKRNVTACDFFRDILKFEIDETSPSVFDPMCPDEYDYEILSKAVPQKKAAKPVPACRENGNQAVH
ncbi:N-alpha-acetyltransferase 40-like isoform X2 [Acanthaster planci]|nr:N-alpha-acetyltransferase 40-like isoform X2 [Acanthaster planci]